MMWRGSVGLFVPGGGSCRSIGPVERQNRSVGEKPKAASEAVCTALWPKLGYVVDGRHRTSRWSAAVVVVLSDTFIVPSVNVGGKVGHVGGWRLRWSATASRAVHRQVGHKWHV